MRVLVACEESQRVCISFQEAGFEAWSCDIKDQSGGYPEWHIRGDAIKEAYSGKYDMLIAFPPCTFLSKAGARFLFPGGKLDPKRYKNGLKAKEFFLRLYDAPIKHIAIENPTQLRIMKMPHHSQVIQPYEFGHPYSKRTLLWLKNLPFLRPTKRIDNFTPWVKSSKHRGSYQPPTKNKEERSKTFWGIARAMSNQWTPENIARMPEQMQLFG